MRELCFWLYLVNSVLLICHEIDAAYWKEWRLLGWFFPEWSDGKHLAVFLLAHVPLLLLGQWGLIETWRGSPTGLIFSLGLGAVGIFACAAHAYFMKRGRPEFRAPVSIGLLTGSLVVSLAQVIVACLLLAGVGGG
jgi:hypothetical protein